MQTILNNFDLVDTSWHFPQDCLPSLLTIRLALLQRIHSTSLWLAFLISAQQERALKMGPPFAQQPDYTGCTMRREEKEHVTSYSFWQLRTLPLPSAIKNDVTMHLCYMCSNFYCIHHLAQYCYMLLYGRPHPMEIHMLRTSHVTSSPSKVLARNLPPNGAYVIP